MDRLTPSAAIATTFAPSSLDDPLRAGVEDAKTATVLQVVSLGLTWTAAPVVQHDAPSAALATLLARHDTAPTAEQAARIAELDALPVPQRAALTAFVDAFLSLEDATAAAYADDTAAWPSHTMAPVFSARNNLLDTIPALRDAFVNAPTATVCQPIAVALVVAIDLTSCDNTYTDDYALVLDNGGDDTYHNNAGGSGIAPVEITDCNAARGGAAAVVDLGPGRDRYGDASAPRDCGVNGGGYLGVGFLFDEGLDDVYVGRDVGVNGGAGLGGIGFLYDQWSGDTYLGNRSGVNGGGEGGAGMLIDRDGDDTYTGTIFGVNGGANVGFGLLIDERGNDRYTATGTAANGGGTTGVALLLDLAGVDTYSDGTVSCTDCDVAPKGLVGAQIDN